MGFSKSTMPMRGIRMIAFLTLAVLAPGCSCKNCSCRCPLKDGVKYGYVCNLISTLQLDRVIDKEKILKLAEKTDDFKERLENISEEKNKTIQEAAMNISLLERAVDDLRNALSNESRSLSNRVQKLEEDTSNRFTVSADERNRLGAKMEKAQRESERQTDALAVRLKNLESLSGELASKWRDQENKIRNLEQEIASKSEEERKLRKKLMKRVEEAEKQTMESKTEVLNRMKQREGRRRETDRFIEEQIQEVNKVVAELSRTVQRATISLTEQQKKSDKLQAKMRKVKSAVTILLTSQSQLKEEIRTNLSFSIERLKTDIEGRLIELKHLGGNLAAKINQIEESQLMLEQELSKCAPLGNLSDLDRAVREHARDSIVEHQSLRSEMSGRVTELREQCAARDDVARVNQTVTSLSTDLQETQRQLQEVREAALKSNCKDILPKETCRISVRKQMCRHEYTATNCCASCAKAPLSLLPKRTKGK